MPLYEYECAHIGLRFEVIQKFSDAPLTRCPECDKHSECDGKAKRLLSAPAIQFKGSGWYVNDYGKGGQKPKKDGESKPAAAEAKKDGKSDSGKSDSGKSDTAKSSSKTETKK